MGKTPYQIQCRAEFDGMVAERNEAKRADRPKIEPHGPVVTVLVVRPVDDMVEIHAAADRRMAADPAYAATCAALDAVLGSLPQLGEEIHCNVGNLPRVLCNDGNP